VIKTCARALESPFTVTATQYVEYDVIADLPVIVTVAFSAPARYPADCAEEAVISCWTLARVVPAGNAAQ
jgi:hypothetical protein